VLLSGNSGITASTRQPLDVIRDEADMRGFFYKLMQETIAVYGGTRFIRLALWPP
jgi:hypothetical protein